MKTDQNTQDLLNHDELHLLIFKYLEAMLENPDEHGIYPTTKFMKNLKQDLLRYCEEKVREARIDELEKVKDDQVAYIKAIAGHIRNTNSWPHNLGTGKASQAFLDWVDRRIEQLRKGGGK